MLSKSSKKAQRGIPHPLRVGMPLNMIEKGTIRFRVATVAFHNLLFFSLSLFLDGKSVDSVLSNILYYSISFVLRQ